MRRSRFLISLGALPLAARGTGQAPLRVVYPNLDGLGDSTLGYQVLQLALQKSGQPFRLSLTEAPTTHVRARLQLEAGEIDMVDFGGNADFERRFHALPFPIDRGLNGWRLFVIRAAAQPDFDAVADIAALRRFQAGQGHDWADIPALEAAGLAVQQAGSLTGLFRMLAAGRFDFLPLGLNEVYGLLDRNRADAPGCVVERRLVLVYPFARLMFVRRGNQALREALQAGLQTAFDDGSFEALFNAHPGNRAAVEQARLAERRVLRIGNPTLTDTVRSIPPRYFFKP